MYKNNEIYVLLLGNNDMQSSIVYNIYKENLKDKINIFKVNKIKEYILKRRFRIIILRAKKIKYKIIKYNEKNDVLLTRII